MSASARVLNASPLNSTGVVRSEFDLSLPSTTSPPIKTPTPPPQLKFTMARASTKATTTASKAKATKPAASKTEDKEKKVAAPKKATVAKTAKATSSHPTWADMIKVSASSLCSLQVAHARSMMQECIQDHPDDARHGVSLQQIKKSHPFLHL